VQVSASEIPSTVDLQPVVGTRTQVKVVFGGCPGEQASSIESSIQADSQDRPNFVKWEGVSEKTFDSNGELIVTGVRLWDPLSTTMNRARSVRGDWIVHPTLITTSINIGSALISVRIRAVTVSGVTLSDAKVRAGVATKVTSSVKATDLGIHTYSAEHNASVRLEKRVSGSKTWTLSNTLQTSESGAVAALVKPTKSTCYRTSLPATATLAGSTSSPVCLTVTR